MSVFRNILLFMIIHGIESFQAADTWRFVSALLAELTKRGLLFSEFGFSLSLSVFHSLSLSHFFIERRYKFEKTRADLDVH